jgi:predicted methyltransferase
MARIAPLVSTLLIALPLLAGCGSMQTRAAADADQAAAGMAAQEQNAALKAAIAGAWRDPKNSARDAYRRPLETLGFFGVRPDQQVVEITPGGAGWYAEILAPYLRERGLYTAAMVDPTVLPAGRGRDFQQKATDDLKARLAAHPAQFDRAVIAPFDPKQPVFAPAGSADTVLTFRNVHNWVSAGTADAYFAGFYAALHARRGRTPREAGHRSGDDEEIRLHDRAAGDRTGDQGRFRARRPQRDQRQSAGHRRSSQRRVDAAAEQSPRSGRSAEISRDRRKRPDDAAVRQTRPVIKRKARPFGPRTRRAAINRRC